VQIISDGNLSFRFPSLNYQFTGASQWVSLYSASQGLQQFSVQNAYGMTLGGELSIVNVTPGASSDLSGSYSLAVFDNTSEVNVDGKPLMYTTQVDLIINYNLVQFGTSCDLSSSFSHHADIGYDLSYTPSTFHDLFDYNAAPGADFGFFSNEDGCNLNPAYAHYEISFITKVTCYFYDQPYLFLDLAEDVEIKYDEWFGKWDKSITALPELNDTLDLFVLGIFDDLNFSINQPLPFDYEYKAPYSLSLVSGALQSAMADSLLAEPVIVQVFDNQGEPVKDARVWIEISGGGALTAESLLTDAEGKVSVNWTLGNNALDIQMLSIRVNLYDDSDIQGSPLQVNANISSCPPTSCGDVVSVTDIDGNVYPVVQIGDQCWMKENLRVTTFNDGTLIPNISDNQIWWDTSTPAWCYYENLSSNNSIYGKLYNWFTVGYGNLCPVGWHVPSRPEWTILNNYLGGYNVAGGKLKSEIGWDYPNVGATNESCFTALPGGINNYIFEQFDYIGVAGVWWSSWTIGAGAVDSWCSSLNHSSSNLNEDFLGMKSGLSVRCLKD
jgi:uncharacterized protein (TIGR02145 family)